MNLKALIAEFIGTFALLFAGVGAIMSVGYLSPQPHDSAAGLIVVALAHGVVIAVAASALGHVSGGHFNPAVTFGLFLAKKVEAGTMLTYWVAQILGAFAGVQVVKLAFEGDAGSRFSEIHGGLPMSSTLISGGQVFVLEAIGTFFLMLVIMGTCVDDRGPKVGAWFVGVTITTMIFAFGPLTGCSINPARWLGPAIATSSYGEAFTYLAAPIVGAAAAALLYGYVLAPQVTAKDSSVG